MPASQADDVAPNILDIIVAGKREEVAAAKPAAADFRARAADQPPCRDFAAALRRPGEVSVIAEAKKASPSAGILRADFDPVAIATAYERAGAAAISVLTDRRHFQGAPEYLSAVRGAVSLPLLRKDFVIDGLQIDEARALGADAVLLIVAILGQAELVDLAGQAASLGLAALVEVHTAEEAVRAVSAGARLIGINNRDLRVFRTDLATSEAIRPQLGDDVLVVSESGIRSAADVARLATAEIDAVLVGEALMRQVDVEAACRALVGVVKPA